MPRRKDDPALGRYAISSTAYKALKRDLRRLYKASQGALEAPETADMDTLLKEVRRISLQALETLRTDTIQIR